MNLTGIGSTIRASSRFGSEPVLRSIFRGTAVVTVLALALTAIAGPLLSRSIGAEDIDPARLAPEFTQQDPAAWINSVPLTLDDLRGKVVLVDFWTFDCWNCYRSFPWLKSLEARFEKEGLQVVGVHTSEFAHEKVKRSVVAKVEEFGLHHPIMIDNDFAYWNAMGNRYWPAYYLLDKQGRIRASFIGETHVGDERAKAVQAAIEFLLGESTPP
jgi:thiol-disulfide isomerase/thioredoxin